MSDRRAAVLLIAALGSLGLCAFSGWWALVGITICCVLLAPVLRTAHPDVQPVRAHGIEFSGCEQPPEAPTRGRHVSRVGDNLARVVAVAAVLGLVLLLVGCQPDDSGTDGQVTNPCAEMDQRPEGCEP